VCVKRLVGLGELGLGRLDAFRRRLVDREMACGVVYVALMSVLIYSWVEVLVAPLTDYIMTGNEGSAIYIALSRKELTRPPGVVHQSS
jgi:hypothetical protein